MQFLSEKFLWRTEGGAEKIEKIHKLTNIDKMDGFSGKARLFMPLRGVGVLGPSDVLWLHRHRRSLFFSARFCPLKECTVESVFFLDHP
jgi:hypothetical protein